MKSYRKDRSLCRRRGCQQPATEKTPIGAMCEAHAKDIPRVTPCCTFPHCRLPVVRPYSAGKCAQHAAHKLTSVELEVLDSMAKGVKGVDAVVAATGLDRAAASRRLTTMHQKVEFRARVPAALEEAGLTPEHIARQIAENIDAKRIGITKEGDTVDMGRDYKASNQAIALAIKLGGMAPEKADKVVDRSTTFNIQQAIVVPQPKPLEPDQPVYVIPKDGK